MERSDLIVGEGANRLKADPYNATGQKVRAGDFR
jgi:hypothetical protein